MATADSQLLHQFYDAQLRALGPERFQKFLEENLHQCLQRMGIGSGADCRTSGEDRVLELLSAADRRGQPLCIFDVGANTGQYLAEIKRRLPHGRPYDLHVFEPSRTAFQALLTSYGKDPAIKLNNFALGREEAEKDLFSDSPGSALGSLYKRRLDHFGITFSGHERVLVKTLDDYCACNSIQQIDLLKLDVEGHELSVLQGASNLFAGRKIALIAFEFGGCNIDSRTYFQDFYYFFQAHGMRLSRITPAGQLVPLTTYHEFYEQFLTTNYLAQRD